MTQAELIAIMDTESTMTETVLLNLLLEYLTTNQQENIAYSLKALMERASRGNTAVLSGGVSSSILNKRSTLLYREDRSKRR